MRLRWSLLVVLAVAGPGRAENVPFDVMGAVANEPGGIDAALAADLDGDGDEDLVYASHLFSRVSWSRNNRTGYSSRVSLFTHADVRRLIAADFDLDGRVDLVSANAAGEIVLRLGTGTVDVNNVPQFETRAAMTTTATNPAVLATGDLNRDGRPDLVVGRDDATAPLQSFLFKESAADGFDGPGAIPAPANAGRIGGLGLADFNLDGFVDVVAAANAPSGNASGLAQVFIVPRTSSAAFGTPVIVASQSGSPAAVPVLGALAVADFDLANGPDLAVLQNQSGNGAAITRRLNAVAGTFDLPSSGLFDSSDARDDTLTAADIDRDGDADVVYAGASGAFAEYADNTRDTSRNPNNVADAPAVGDGVATLVFDDDLDGDPDILLARAGGDILRARNVRIHGRSFLQPIFAPAFTSNPGLSAPFDAIVRRVGRTSRREVLIAESGGGRVLSLTMGTGLPAFAATPVMTGVNGAQDMSVLDFDYDGDEDIALVTATTVPATPNQNRIVLGRNQAAPTTEVQDCTGGTDLRSIVLGEIGNVPGLSIAGVYAAETNDRVALFAGCPAETTISTAANGVPDAPTAVNLADLDRDGDRDVMVTSGDGMRWYPNSGAGAFGAANRLNFVEGVRDTTLADVDRDGRLDAVFAVSDEASITARAVFVLGSSRDGVFDDVAIASAGVIASPGRVEAADADHDGDIDLFVPSSAESARAANRTHCGINFLEAQPDGSYAAPRCLDLGVNQRPYSRLAVDDVNADGVPDVVATSAVDNAVLTSSSGRPAQFMARTQRLVENIVLGPAREVCIFSYQLEHLGRAADSKIRYGVQVFGANRFDTQDAVGAIIIRRDDDGDGVPEPTDTELARALDPRAFDNTWAMAPNAEQGASDGPVQYWICLALTAQPPGPFPPLEIRETSPFLSDAHRFAQLRGIDIRTDVVPVPLLWPRLFADGLEGNLTN